MQKKNSYIKKLKKLRFSLTYFAVKHDLQIFYLKSKF